MTSLLGFAFWSIAANRITPSAVGLATAAVSLAAVTALVTSNGLIPALMVRLPACNTAEARRVLIATLLAGGATSAVTDGIATAAISRTRIITDGGIDGRPSRDA